MPADRIRERRRYPRLSWQEIVPFLSADRPEEPEEMTRAEDITERGIRLISSAPLSPGHVLILAIPVAGTTVKIRSPAFVRWCVPLPTGGHKCGLEFII